MSAFDWSRLLSPAVLALSIPIIVVLLAGIRGIMQARNSEPSDFAEWKREVMDLRARVETLEQTRDQRH